MARLISIFLCLVATTGSLSLPIVKDGEKYQGEIVFVGDSITQFWDWDVWNEYYAPLGAVNKGVSGDVTQQTIDRIVNNGMIDNLDSRVAVLKIGTNDLDRGPGADGDDNYIATQIGNILNLIKEKEPRVRIVLLGILPRRGEAYHQRIRNINDMIKNYDDGVRVRFLNMEAQYSTGLGKLIDGLFTDGLHLTKQGYQVWAETMQPLFQELYNGPQ